MAAVPSIGRASAVEPRPAAPEAELTRALYERHSRQIFAYCLHRLGNREEAEDATQTTFMNAFRGLQRGVVPELESAWLHKIANNVILTRRRSSSRRRRVETPGDLDAIQDLLPSRERDADELIRLTEALSTMPDQQRHALLLREWQGLSYREIGEEMQLSQAAVETLLFRARRTLAQGLTEPGRPRRGLRSGLDLGSMLAGLKGLVGGGLAVKAVTTAAVVATTAVVAADPMLRHKPAPPPAPAPAPVVHPPAPVAAASRIAEPVAAESVTPVRAVERPRAVAAPRHVRRVAVRKPVAVTPPVRHVETPAPPVPEPVAVAPPVVRETPAPPPPAEPKEKAQRPERVRYEPAAPAREHPDHVKGKDHEPAAPPPATQPAAAPSGPHGNGKARRHDEEAAPAPAVETPPSAPSPEISTPPPASAPAAEEHGRPHDDASPGHGKNNH